MILEEETFKKFGYYPRELTSQSNKSILVKCIKCGKLRKSSKNAYRELCTSCALKNRHYVTNEIKDEKRYAGIDEIQTLKKFGYYSFNLSSHSERKIITKCIKCEKEREISKNNYRDLCHLCSSNTKEHKRKLSKALKGRIISKEAREKQSKALRGRIPTKEHRQHLSDALKGRKLSKEHIENMRKAISGKNNSNWKDGTSVWEFEKSYGLTRYEWSLLTRQIRKRDNYICQYCGKSPSYEVHHIRPRHIKIDNRSNNLITLCKSCHPKVEKLTKKHIKQGKEEIEIFYDKWSEN